MATDELLLAWLEVLERDLGGFADPHTDVSVKDQGRQIVALWSQRGREQQAEFVLTEDGDFRWLAESGQTLYRQFLASGPMGDFEQLTDAILLNFQREPHYVSTTAQYESSDDETPTSGASDSLLVDGIDSSLSTSEGKTQLVFVKGDAGAGKTTLLRELTSRQAERFKTGKSSFLFFYVSAQGRALSNLRDAFAGELQDLRTGFTRDAVPPLVRHGLLVPIVDGFDELLGAAGYGDAFGSLQQFLQDLDGQGVVVVSARSSFYDVEFLGNRVTPTAAAFDLMPIRLHPWTQDELDLYFARTRGRPDISDADSEAMRHLSERDRELLGKPFFARQFIEYVDAGEAKTGQSLHEFLIDSYVRRESEKIVDRDGHPLLPLDGHYMLFREAAEVMWTYENRRLKTDDLRTLAEMAAEECGLSGDGTRQLSTRITSYAGFSLSDAGAERDFGFEHEVYFDHFLSRALASRLESGSLDAAFLNSGVLPQEVTSAAIDGSGSERVFDQLEEIGTTAGAYDNLRRNSGSLLAALIRKQTHLEDGTVQNADFINVAFGRSQLERVRFVNCTFRGTDFTDTQLTDCLATDSLFDAVIISGDVVFDVRGLVPGGNVLSVVDRRDVERQTFSPVEIRQVLASVGASELKEPPPPPPEFTEKGRRVLELLRRFIATFQSANVVCQQDGRPNIRRVFEEAEWPDLRRLLLDYEIVREEVHAARGPRKTFMRPHVSLVEVMRYESERDLPDDAIGRFWSALRSL